MLINIEETIYRTDYITCFLIENVIIETYLTAIQKMIYAGVFVLSSSFAHSSKNAGSGYLS